MTSTGGSIDRVTLFTRTNLSSSFTEHNLVKTQGSDSYTYVENTVNLIGVKSVDYYLEVSDGLNPVLTSATKTIENPKFNDDPVRLNVSNGQYVRGTVAVRGTTSQGKTTPTLKVDGTTVDGAATTKSLESEPYIAADVTQTDIFFMNSFTKKLVVSGTPDGTDWKNNVIGTFDDGTYGATSTVSFPVSLSDIPADGKFSLYLNSGTKSSPTDILDEQKLTVNTENADDYTASNIRLVLPDGTVLRVSKAVAGISPGSSGTVTEQRDVTDKVKNAGEKMSMGDSEGTYEFLRLDFAIDASSIASRQYLWNTAKTTDGSHTVQAVGESGENATAKVVVDNTAPVIDASVAAKNDTGTVKRGAISIDATAHDAGSGVQAVGTQGGTVSATLSNGSAAAQRITLPYATSSAELPSGTHTVVFTANDNVGNATTKTVTFTTVQEQPTIISTGGTRQQNSNAAQLNAKVAEAANDKVTAVFHPGERVTPSDESVTSVQGTTDRSGLGDDAEHVATALSSAQNNALASGEDGKTVSTTGTNYGFPFQEFTVTVPQSFVEDAQASATLSWSGSAEPNADIYAFVRNAVNGSWEQVAYVRANGQGKASIEQQVALKDRVQDGKIKVEIQNGSGYTSGQQTAGASAASSSAKVQYANSSTINGVGGTPVITTDGDSISQTDTPRSDYDFTFAWESDTQYYNANYAGDGYYQHQKDIHDWLLKNRTGMNIQYLFHTGDIVDNADIADQWTRADEQYKRLDDAHFPYGVLAGNHDVDHKSENYTNFSKYFGQSRYDSNPWYGGSYENNRGHYDLISAGGVDFIVVSVGWGIGDSEIDWMNQVLAKYPNRVAILDFHEYLLASGGLGLVPQQIYQRVVKKNKNVKMVLSGHYHSAQKTVSQIDDDGDGKPDRNVVNMLFDYQSLDEGGMGFMRLLHFNLANATMEVRTYSPSIKKYGSQTVPSSSFKSTDEEFTVDLSQLGISARTGSKAAKTLTSDAMDVDLLSSKVIATSQAGGDNVNGAIANSAIRNRAMLVGAQSQEIEQSLQAIWSDAPAARTGWYVVVSNPYGGTATSDVTYLDPAKPSTGDQGGDANPGHANGTGSATGSDDGSHADHGTNGPTSQQGTKHGESVSGTQEGQAKATSISLAATGVDTSYLEAGLLVLLAAGSAIGAKVLSGRRRRTNRTRR